MNIRKVFISGKITGEYIPTCYKKFQEAEKELKASDIKLNPLKLSGIYFGISHRAAMVECLGVLANCSHIYMLRDWEDSPGAIQEHKFAKAKGLEIIYQL